jgi:hypothetical protein
MILIYIIVPELCFLFLCMKIFKTLNRDVVAGLLADGQGAEMFRRGGEPAAS